MKRYIQSIFFLFFSLSCTNVLICQSAEIDNALLIVTENYGIDQELVNGKVFMNQFRNDIGFPFLFNDDFKLGSLTIHKKTYDNLLFKYNVYDQTLLLKYNIGTQLTFSPPSDFITAFTFHNLFFRKQVINGYEERFYQVLNSGNISCLYFWQKKRGPAVINGSQSVNEYYKEEKEMFLQINDTISSYKSRGSFLKLYPEKKRKEISKYIKTHKIKLKTSSDEEIINLISFCNDVLDK